MSKEAEEYLKKNISYGGFFRIEAEGFLETITIAMQSYADQEVKKKQLKEAYQLTGNPMVGKYEYELNKILNEAFTGKNRIKGVVSSNKICEFVRNYLTPKQISNEHY